MSRVIAPLHNHSQWSALDGWSRPEEIAERVIEIGACGCGLTDHGVVTGHLETAKVLDKYDIKFVPGMEAYHGLNHSPERTRDQAHLILLASTNKGLKNLWTLANLTAAKDHFHHVGRLYWEDLEQYSEGIVATSACALGLVPQQIIKGDYSALDHYLHIFKDNFYIEISTYPASKTFVDEGSDGFNMQVYNEALVAVAAERGIPVVYGDDGHYAKPEHFEFHDAYLARQTGQSIYTPIDERKMYHPPGAVSIKDLDAIYNNLSYLPTDVIDEAIDNAVAIVENASVELPEIRRHLPMYVPSRSPWLSTEQKALTPEELFIDLVTDGIESRYPEADDDVWERAAYECGSLIHDGIHHYFLMGWDEMQIADSLGIERGPGRGSSAGSIVAYALGITDVDPLHYGLMFERFWNPGRAEGFPDIDSDFARARRDDMLEQIKDRWGHNKVVAIGTTGYLKPKAVIDKMAATCGISQIEAKELKEIVGKTTKIDILGHEQIGWSEELEPGKKYYVETELGDKIVEWIGDDERREYFVNVCRYMCSRVSQYGIHASGIVISDVDTADELPAAMRGGKDGIPATMFPMADVDKRMFVKLDVLGLRTLDVLEYWRQEMKRQYDIDVVWSGLDKEDHPQEMWDLLADGYTAGIFQVEDGYGRQLCKQMKPQSVLDLAVLNALNRPGPIQAKIPDAYIARRNGDEAVTYPHPRFQELMEESLDSTYGLWVFQEQIITYFNVLGYTLGESDAIRKIMGKKKPEQMDAVRDGLEEWDGRGYLDMAVAAGIPLDVAQDIWSDIEGFADYCFNKAHTVAYAIICFRTLYAKYYGFGEFHASVMRSLDPGTDSTKREEMLPQHINECRRQKVPVYPPDIRKSRAYPHMSEEGAIYFGFGDIAGVRSSGQFVVDLRDKHGLDISSSSIFVEKFDEFNDNWNAEKKRLAKEGIVMAGKSPKSQLNSKKMGALCAIAWNLQNKSQMTMSEMQQIEKEYLGVILTDNSLEVLERNRDELDHCDSYMAAKELWVDKVGDDEEVEYIDYKLPGVITNIIEKTARKSGEPFAIVTMEYEGSEIEFVVFAKNWKTVKRSFSLLTPGIFLIRQRPDNDYGPSYCYQQGSKLR